MTTVAIIDGGGANIASLQFALERLGAASVLTRDAAVIAAAPRVILPGVGAAANAMDSLRRAFLTDTIKSLRQPVLGICLGMQLLFAQSEEDSAACLGILAGTVRRFPTRKNLPVPHMGWNRVKARPDSRLLLGLPDESHFYFVHSYAADISAATTGTTHYGSDFSAAVEYGNFMGTQFHPERSGKNGARVLQNFLAA